MHFIPILLHWMQQIQSAGWMGWILFIGLYALCCLFFIPASVLTFAAGAVWGFWGGTALVLAGNGLGSILCLLLTRYFFRAAATRILKRHEKWKAVVKAVQEDGWKIVFWTRLSPVMPFSLINYSLGLTKISAWRFLLATELGSVPAIAAYVYFGTLAGNLAKLKSDVSHHGVFYWTMQAVGVALAIGVTVYVTLLARKTLKGQIKK